MKHGVPIGAPGCSFGVAEHQARLCTCRANRIAVKEASRPSYRPLQYNGLIE